MAINNKPLTEQNQTTPTVTSAEGLSALNKQRASQGFSAVPTATTARVFTPDENTGLMSASARQQAGTSGVDESKRDATNLSFAKSQGWTPPTRDYVAEGRKEGEQFLDNGKRVVLQPDGTTKEVQDQSQVQEEKVPEMDYSTKVKNISSIISSGVTDSAKIAQSLGMDIKDVDDALLDPSLANAKAQVELTNTRQKQYDDMIKAQQDISNGIIKLTTDEQAQIDYATSLLEQTKADQLEANENYQKGLGVFNTITGLAEFAPGRAMESLHKAITKGNQIIRNLDVEAIAKISELKQLFLDKKYKEVKENYEKLDKIAEEKGKTIQSIYKDTVDAVNKYEESKSKKEQQVFENILNSEKFSWQQKIDFLKLEADKNKDDRDYGLKLKQYQLDVAKAQAADTPANRAEYELSGGATTGKSYEQFLLEKGRASEKPATADQQKNSGYALRIKNANDTILNMTNSLIKQGYLGGTVEGFYPNALKTEDRQRLERAEIDFVNAALRPESGAAIAVSEFTNAEKQYFPQPGDSAKVIQDKAKARLLKLQGTVTASGNALSDEFKNSVYKPPVFTTIEDAYFSDAELASKIEEFQDKHPEMSDVDLLQIINESGFSGVGGDTDTATIEKVSAIPNGTKGGQCGRFVNNLTGLGLGDTYQSKIAKMNPAITTPTPGMVFVMPYKDTGHTGIILDVKDGVATVKDSNYGLDGKVKTHKIPVSKMTGFNFA